MVREWWTNEEGIWPEPVNDFMEAQQEWWKFCEETYNFKITTRNVSTWTSCTYDFIDYVTVGGYEDNYVYVLHSHPDLVSGMAQGMMYDPSTIPWLDFTKENFTRN